MPFVLKLALKNLFRHRLRTFVSVVAIAFSVLIVVFAKGYVDGLIESTVADHIQYNSGHIKIIDQQYHQQERLLPLNYPVDGFAGEGLDEMITRLSALTDVEMVIPRLKFAALISTDEELVTLYGWGVNPEQELAFTQIEKELVEGRMVRPGQREVVMGSALLAKLGLGVGDKVTILANTAYGSLTGVTFTIVGRILSSLKMLNEFVFYLPLDQAQRILFMESQATELLLVSKNRELVPQLLPQVKQVLAENGAGERYLVLGYKETSDLIALMDVAEVIYNYIYVFLVLLACIVVINTLIMIVAERRKEIGMMGALGLEPKDILLLFLIEGGIMGVIGSLLGAVSGTILTRYVAQTGIDYTTALAGFSEKHLISPIIYPIYSVENTIFAFVLGAIVVTIACLIPARRAAKLEPTEAMREG